MSDTELARLGLEPGDRVRFRRREAGRWHEARVERRERDGSIRLRDGKGAARAIPIDRLEVQVRGPRGAAGWEPLTVHAARIEQLRLL